MCYTGAYYQQRLTSRNRDLNVVQVFILEVILNFGCDTVFERTFVSAFVSS